MAMEMLNDVMTSTYLARIGWEGDVPVTRKTLDGLVYAHQCSVPFETADLVALGETPSLEMSDLYQKIVVDRHGGFCFELNKMFELLLRSVGFEVRPCFSRAVRGREGRMPINHRGTLVPSMGAAFGRRRVRRTASCGLACHLRRARADDSRRGVHSAPHRRTLVGYRSDFAGEARLIRRRGPVEASDRA